MKIIIKIINIIGLATLIAGSLLLSIISFCLLAGLLVCKNTLLNNVELFSLIGGYSFGVYFYGSIFLWGIDKYIVILNQINLKNGNSSSHRDNKS